MKANKFTNKAAIFLLCVIIYASVLSGQLLNINALAETVPDTGDDNQLILNEVVLENKTLFFEDGGRYDWIELKNNSDQEIQLEDYWISDCLTEHQIQLPKRRLRPGEFLLIVCSGDINKTTPSEFHVSFSLSDAEDIWLFKKNGSIADHLPLDNVPLYGSVGRMPGSAEVVLFREATPRKENENGFASVCASPAASVPQGVYENAEPFLVELEGKGDIFYTLDGSTPSEQSSVYTEPIEVSKTTVIRAICCEKGKLCSDTASFSYIVNEGDHLPVTSVVCEPRDMFGYGGVYNSQRIDDVSCIAQVSFFDGSEGFTTDCMVKLHGASSRRAEKKSFRLGFTSRLDGDLQYDLFQDGNVTDFHSLLLRGGDSSRLMLIRDSFVSKLAMQTYPELYPQDTRYTVLYINGKYYGLYAWREDYSEEYFSSHTGAKESEIQVVRAPLPQGELLDLVNFVRTHSMSYPEYYAYVEERLDLESLCAWAAFQAYTNNQDPNGNIRYVKLGPDAKWQLILYDLDLSMLDSNANWDIPVYAYEMGDVIQALRTNENFRQLLLETCSKLVDNGFTTDTIQTTMNNLIIQFDESDVLKDCERWGFAFFKWDLCTKSIMTWLNEERMDQWMKGLQRLAYVTDEQMQQYFG